MKKNAFFAVLALSLVILACDTPPDSGDGGNTPIPFAPGNIAVTGVSLNKESASIAVNGQEALFASIEPANATNKAVNWISSNIAVAKVEDGIVTGVDGGTATITVTTADGGKTASCTVTVSPKVITFTVDTISAQTYTGSAHTPAVTVRDGTAILTQNTDYTVAYTNNTNAGTATVTITGAGNYAGSSGSRTFTILQTVSPDRIEYCWVDQHGSLVTTSGNAVTINVGEILTITAPAQGTGYAVKQWHLNGVDTGFSGNPYSFSSVTPGSHIVGLLVEKDGKFYNTNIAITVQ